MTIAYQNDFLLMTLMGVLCLPLVLAFRRPQAQPGRRKPAPWPMPDIERLPGAAAFG